MLKTDDKVREMEQLSERALRSIHPENLTTFPLSLKGDNFIGDLNYLLITLVVIKHNLHLSIGTENTTTKDGKNSKIYRVIH